MTWLIAIDESGDTGSGSRFFTMAAIIVSHERQLLPAIKAIPSGPKEFKFYNSLPERIEPVLCALSGCCVDIVYVVADKHDYRSEYYGLYGNALYSSVLEDLMIRSMHCASGHDVDLEVDDNSFMTLGSMKELAMSCSSRCGCNLKKCNKVISHHNKNVQIADLVVGSIHRSYENGESRFISMIEKKIHRP